MKKTVWVTLAIIIALCLSFDVYMFMVGSLESIPTPEQLEKGRITYGVIAIPLILSEIFVIRKILRKN